MQAPVIMVVAFAGSIIMVFAMDKKHMSNIKEWVLYIPFISIVCAQAIARIIQELYSLAYLSLPINIIFYALIPLLITYLMAKMRIDSTKKGKAT